MFYVKTKNRPNASAYKKTLATLPSIEEVSAYMSKYDLSPRSKPYMFTHIPLSDGTIITQTVAMGDTEVLVSPEQLWNALTCAV
jgi:hypothetical protein